MVYNINMEINEKFFNTIYPVLNKLKERIAEDFVVFGSAPLYLIGVVSFDKPINDLDIALKDKNAIPKDAKEVTFQKNKNQKLYKLIIKGIKVDMGTCWKGQEDYFYRLFENPILVKGFKFANLEILEEWKEKMIKEYNREKDKIYLEKIKKFKSKLKDE